MTFHSIINLVLSGKSVEKILLIQSSAFHSHSILSAFSVVLINSNPQAMKPAGFVVFVNDQDLSTSRLSRNSSSRMLTISSKKICSSSSRIRGIFTMRLILVASSLASTFEIWLLISSSPTSPHRAAQRPLPGAKSHSLRHRQRSRSPGRES